MVTNPRSSQFTKSRMKSLAYKPMKITALQVSYTSKTDAKNSERIVMDALDWFFTNRGFMMLPGQDEADVLYWTARFAKMLCKSEKKVDLSILRIGDSSGLFLVEPK